jgi:hypothetical protein
MKQICPIRYRVELKIVPTGRCCLDSTKLISVVAFVVGSGSNLFVVGQCFVGSSPSVVYIVCGNLCNVNLKN